MKKDTFNHYCSEYWTLTSEQRKVLENAGVRNADDYAERKMNWRP